MDVQNQNKSELKDENASPAGGGSDKLRALLTRAVQGDLTTLPGLREFLGANAAVWREVGDLALKAERSWIGMASGDDLVVRESMALELKRVADSLADENAPPAERLLARQAALAWLEGAYYSARCAQTGGVEMSLAHREFLHRRADRAQAKFAAAVKQLAVVRNLLRPVPTPASRGGEPGTATLGSRRRTQRTGRSRVGS